jgi:hypothetical protein
MLCAALAIVVAAAATPAHADDDFPIVGIYTKDEACKGAAVRRLDLIVKITKQEIASNMGTCTILHHRRDGKSIAMQVECRTGDQPIIGDVTFTMRDENTVDFDDQDHTSPAVLHRCGAK